MLNGSAWKAALKMFAIAFAGFLLCVGSGYVLNGIPGAVWGMGAGIVFWIWLVSLLESPR